MVIVNAFRNEMVQGAIGISLFLLLLIASCSGPQMRAEPGVSHVTETATVAAPLNTPPAGLAAAMTQAHASPSDYRVGPEDLLEITVFQAKELDSIVRVTASGYIRFPLIEKLHVEGLTVYEFENLLAERLKVYLSEPVVSVFVKEYRSQQITVLGSVKNPGVFYVSGQRSVLDLLSLSGGLNEDAGDVCIVQRNGNTSDEAQKTDNIVIDLEQLIAKGRVEFNIPMHSGDVVLVPKSGIFFVDGAVNSPGSFHLKGKTTVTQAISVAKGFSFDAIRSEVNIYRDDGGDERKVVKVNYDDILERKSPDIELREKDIVIVSQSAMKRFVRGIAGYFNFGFFGLRSPGI